MLSCPVMMAFENFDLTPEIILPEVDCLRSKQRVKEFEEFGGVFVG